MKNLYPLLKMLIIIIVLVATGQWINLRFDLTKNHRYTLSDQTKVLLKNVDQPLKIDIFLEGKLPAEFLRLRKEVFLRLRLVAEKRTTGLNPDGLSSS